jgi:hypothetical protein
VILGRRIALNSDFGFTLKKVIESKIDFTLQFTLQNDIKKLANEECSFEIAI